MGGGEVGMEDTVSETRKKKSAFFFTTQDR